MPYFSRKSEKYFSNRSPEYVNPAAVDSPAPAPIMTASAAESALASRLLFCNYFLRYMRIFVQYAETIHHDAGILSIRCKNSLAPYCERLSRWALLTGELCLPVFFKFIREFVQTSLINICAFLLSIRQFLRLDNLFNCRILQDIFFSILRHQKSQRIWEYSVLFFLRQSDSSPHYLSVHN